MKALSNIFVKIMKPITKVEMFIAELMLTALIMVTITGTITRYFMGMPFTWMEEFQLACVVWIVFLTGSAAFYTKAHVAIEMVVDLFPEKWQKVVDVFIGVVVLVVLVFVVLTSVKYLGVFMRSGRCTPILKVPYAWVYGIVPVACVLMILEYIHGLLDPYVEEEEEEA